MTPPKIANQSNIQTDIPSINPGSFRDPSGWVFTLNGTVYRQVNRVYQKNYDKLMNSGLYQALTEKKLLIKHEVADISPVNSDLCYKIVEPTQVSFISYPYEWCFSQLRAAAITTLEIQKIALNFEMCLKDASAFNIQFIDGKAVLIDTLSFEDYREGSPWVAYRQFCQHFLAPLLLMQDGHIGHGRLSQLYIDGIPLDYASSVLSKRTWFNLSTLIHIHLHGWAQITAKGNSGEIKKVSKNALLGIIDNLYSVIRKVKLKQNKSVWAHYYSDTNYSADAFENKKKVIKDLLLMAKSNHVWDLGANTGFFSRICSNDGIQTIAFDLDPLAVEYNWQEVEKKQEKNILPLVMDITNPSPGIGWNNQERVGLSKRKNPDTIMALALIHHLAIANNLPLWKIALFFSEMCQNAIVEFIPKSDSQVQRLLSSRKDIFDDYQELAFEESFSSYFKLINKIKIENSQRTIYLFKRLNPPA